MLIKCKSLNSVIFVIRLYFTTRITMYTDDNDN